MFAPGGPLAPEVQQHEAVGSDDVKGEADKETIEHLGGFVGRVVDGVGQEDKPDEVSADGGQGVLEKGHQCEAAIDDSHAVGREEAFLECGAHRASFLSVYEAAAGNKEPFRYRFYCTFFRLNWQ